MIYLFFCIGCVLCYACHKRKKHLEAQQETKGVAYAFTISAFDVLVPFMTVTFLYAILSFYLNDMGSDKTTLEALRSYERTITWIKGNLGYVRPNAYYSFLLVAGWFLLTSVVRVWIGNSGTERMDRLFAKYDSYSKWMRRVSTVIALLASFTFFGSQVDGIGGELQAHIKTIKDNYNAFAGDMEKAVEGSVADDTYRKINKSAPPQYTRLSNLHRQTWDRYKVHVQENDEPKARYEVKSPQFDDVVLKIKRQEANIASATEKAGKSAEASKSTTGTTPGTASETAPKPITEPAAETSTTAEREIAELSLNRVLQLKQQAEAYLVSTAARVEPILETPTGKKVVPSLIGMLIKHDHVSVLKGLVADAPLLGPVISVFEKALQKKGELKTNEIIHRLAQKAVTTPDFNLSQGIKSEVDVIVSKVPVEWETIPQAEFDALEARLRADDATISRATADAESRLKAKKSQTMAENRTLQQLLRDRWKSLLSTDTVRYRVSKHISEPNLFTSKPSASEMNKAFEEMLAETRTINEPFEQKAVLKSTLETLNESITQEKAMESLGRIEVYSGGVSPFRSFRELHQRFPQELAPRPRTYEPYKNPYESRPRTYEPPVRTYEAPTYRPRPMPRR